MAAIGSIVRGTLFALITFFVVIMALVTFPLSPRGSILLFLARIWARSVLFVWGVRVDRHVAEDINWQRPLIVMPNHQSHVDTLLLYATITKPLKFIAKHTIKYVPLFGWAMALSRFIFINRSNQQQAFRSIDRAADRIAQGTSIVVFPEGTRSPDAQLLPFKKGGFVLAVKSGAPIVPVYIWGTRHILRKNDWIIRSGRARIWVGSPIETNSYTLETKGELMDRVRQALQQLKVRDEAEYPDAASR